MSCYLGVEHISKNYAVNSVSTECDNTLFHIVCFYQATNP